MEIELLEEYLKNTDLTIDEIIERNALTSIIQAMRAYHNEQLRIGSSLFTAEEVVNELEQCDTLDDALMYFRQNWIE